MRKVGRFVDCSLTPEFVCSVRSAFERSSSGRRVICHMKRFDLGRGIGELLLLRFDQILTVSQKEYIHTANPSLVT